MRNYPQRIFVSSFQHEVTVIKLYLLFHFNFSFETVGDLVEHFFMFSQLFKKVTFRS